MPKEDSVSKAAGWDAYFTLVRTLKWADVESEELEYKRDTERYLRSVSNEVLSSNENWVRAAKGDCRKNLNNLCFGKQSMLCPSGMRKIRVRRRQRYGNFGPRTMTGCCRGIR